MNIGDHVTISMSTYMKWLHAHHDVRQQSCTEDMYSFAGVDVVHTSTKNFNRLDGFITVEIIDPRKYLAAKLRYGI